MTGEISYEITYEIDVAREVSTDFLREARDAIYQEEMKRLAKDFAGAGYGITTLHRFGPRTVSLVLAATDPEPLHALAAAAQEIGYELPEPTERPASAVPDSPSATAEDGLVVPYERWVLATAVELAFELAFETGIGVVVGSEKAEAIILERLAPHADPAEPDSYLVGYPECLASTSYEGPEPVTRDLLRSLYYSAWDKSGFSAPDVLSGAPPEEDPYVVGLYLESKPSERPARKLAFYDRPDPRDLACSGPEDLRALHGRISQTITKTLDTPTL